MKKSGYAYTDQRDALIDQAVEFANKATDGNKAHEDWDRIYIKRMDYLSFNAGLQEMRYQEGKSMKKRDFLRILAVGTDTTQREAEHTLKIVIDIIQSELDSGGLCKVPGLGTFRQVNVKEKRGSNPQTQAPMMIPAHRSIRFTAAKVFKAACS